VKRRNFIRTISAASIAVTTAKASIHESTNLSVKKLIKPVRLKRGDTIALITPGSYITETEKEESINNLRNLGFNVIYSDKLMQKNGYFSAIDEERASDLNEMFDRKDVQGIMCARGGYGCARILPYLDYELITKNPKPFIGFSDVTAIHYAIYKKSNLVTFHGPVSISTFSRFSISNFENVLMKKSEDLILENSSSRNNHNQYGITTISEGIAHGELIGGNLSIVTSLIGTEYDIDYSGKILFIEDIDEYLYHIDRMMMQLKRSSKLRNLAGMIVGGFTKMKDNEIPYGKNALAIIHEHVKDYGYPVAFEFPAGHIRDNRALIMGRKISLSVTGRQSRIEFL